MYRQTSLIRNHKICRHRDVSLEELNKKQLPRVLWSIGWGIGLGSSGLLSLWLITEVFF